MAASLGLAAGGTAAAQPPATPTASLSPAPKRLAIREPRGGPQRPGTRPGPASSTLVASTTTPRSPARVGAAPEREREAAPAPAQRFRIRDDSGHCVVARLHGRYGDQTALMQPDGQLGFPSLLVPTDEPFEPMTAAALRARLQEGPFAAYQVLTTSHYLIFYQSRRAFAEESARLLEDLYRGLIDWCRKHELPVHDAEFPLVAVIFATERDFRAQKPVAPEVQAYYEIFTNRIFFYQQSDRDAHEPKLTALRRPQTVAHEGAHQILANIGVQPRGGAWPLWLVEGLAEYCATPTPTKKGVAWDRLGAINALHMATLRELVDPLANPEEAGPGTRAHPSGRAPLLCQAGALIPKAQLAPTDYAQAWALTYYLAQRRGPDFVRFLRAMSRMPPLQPRTPEEHLAEFRQFFGDDLAKLDKRVDEYIRRLSRQGRFDPLPYYVMMFEQPLGGGVVRRQAIVSQSPQVIQEWMQEMSAPQGGLFTWQAFPTKARAEWFRAEWMRGF